MKNRSSSHIMLFAILMVLVASLSLGVGDSQAEDYSNNIGFMKNPPKELKEKFPQAKSCYLLEPVFDNEKGKLRPIEPVCRVLEQNMNQFCDQLPMVSGLKIAPKFQNLLTLPEWTPLDPEANRSLIEAFIRASWADARLMSDAEKDKRWEEERPGIEKAFAEKRIAFSQAQLDLYNLGKNQTVYRLDYGRENFTLGNIKSWRKRNTSPIIIQYAPEIIKSLYKYIIQWRVDILGELFIYDGKTYSYWMNGEYIPSKSPPYHVKFDIFRTDRHLREASPKTNPISMELRLQRDHICTFLYKSPQEAKQ